MKRQTVILPFILPRLTDKAAAQFIELLHELAVTIEHHYAKQAHRHRKHQQEIQNRRKSPPPPSTDPLF